MFLGLVFILLTVAGFLIAIIGLCGIREHGTQGLLGKGIAGLLINGMFLIFFGVAVVIGFQKSSSTRQSIANLQSDEKAMQANFKQSYNSKTGNTNADFNSIDRIQGDIKTAAQASSGDNALILQAMSRHVALMRSAMKGYYDAAAKLRTGHVLVASNLTDKAQIIPRRELVQDFMVANDNLLFTITNSETYVRAALESQKIPPQKIPALMAAFEVKFAPRRDLDVQIRECDVHMGQSMLAILDVLETDWGNWHFDTKKNKIYFNDSSSRAAYQESLEVIKFAGSEQVSLQGKLVNLP